MSGDWAVRPEAPGEESVIREVTTRAFADRPYAGGDEADIIDRLRAAGDLALSLVAAGADGTILGHAAFSQVTIAGHNGGWFGLGPVSVLPEWQRRGAGSALIRRGLEWLKQGGAAGCVVLGNPDYYERFGFVHDPALRYPGPPAAYFQRLVFEGQPPSGEVSYAEAFG